MFDLTKNETGTIIRLLRKQEAHRRRRAEKGDFVPGPDQKNADATAADYLAALISKLEKYHGRIV